MAKTKKTVIFMGYTCNNKCIFCCNENKREIIKDDSTNIIKQRILDAKKEGSSYLELIGGEPTIRKDIFEIVKFAKKLKFDTIMFATNGRMFSDEEFAKKIIDNGVTHVVFSIHGHTPELHDLLTQMPGSFNQLVKGLKNLQKLGFRNIGSNTAIIKQNYMHLREIGEKIYSLGIRNSEFIFVDPTSGAPKDRFFDIVPTYEETSPYINELLAFGKRRKIKHWHIRYYPLCFIEEGYHDMISDIHENKSFDVQHVAPDFSNKDVIQNRKKMRRVKIEKCLNCKYYDKCEGYWKEYVSRISS